MSRLGDVAKREIVAVNSTSGTLFRGSRFAIVQSCHRLRCYAGEFLMAVPNPDQPVTSSAAEPHFSNQLPSRLDPQTRKGRANTAGMEALLQVLAQQEDVIRQGGGLKAIEAQHAKKRLTARERLALLLDPNEEFLELGLFAAYGMYEEWGGAAAAGVVTGLGWIAGRLVMVIANDATVKAGAFFPMTAKKVLRAQTIAMENRIPTIYLVDSSGVFLPLQEDVFPDTDDFGRIFRNNAVMSSLGIPQITSIMNMYVAVGAYLPVMTDTVLMTEGSGLFLAGPSLGEAAMGQKYSSEELGGATMHAEISGTVDFKEPNDHLCLARLRSLVGRLGHGRAAPFDRAPYDAQRDAPKYAPQDLYALFDPDPSKGASNSYDMHEVVARLVDRSEFDEYKADYGKTVLCGYARIGGYAVGIVANQKTHQTHTSQTGEKRVEFGGVIYAESAEKAARFIMDCNQNLIPLIFLHDVNGFMVGRDAEWSGIIRAGAQMVSAVANSTVPKITVLLGGSFGAGHYAMCGKAYDPRFLFAWPTARYAVMSGASAAGTLVEIKIRQLERGGKQLSEEEKRELFASIQASYDEQTDSRYAAARLWVDAIIDPAKTRDVLLTALKAVALNPEVEKFNPGVIQT